MIKNLRYLLLSLLTIMSTATFAQKTVTIDFDNDYQALFPSLAGVSSSDSQDGDFTGVTNSTLVDGVVMVAIDPDAEASTPSRIWTSSPRLRMYSGSFTVISLGLPITKIEFNAHSKNFNLTAVNGTLDERVWTGSSNGPIFMVTKNTQISSIVVTLGEGGDTPDNPDLPISNDLLSKFTFNSGSFTDKDNQMVFDFAGVAVYNEQNVDLTGNFVFDLDENQICTKTTVNLTFPSVVLAQLAYLDTQANSEDYESVLLSGSTLTAVIKDGFNGYSKLVIKSMLKIILDNEQGGLGILESPMSPNQANVIAGTLEKGQTSEEDYYIKGKIASIKYEFSAQYGTATFFISIDGQNDFTFQCYSVYYLENKPWVEGNTQIKVGDEVIICGKLVNFNGNTPETASKKAYIYSLNGKTQEEGGDNPDPQPGVTTATCAEVLAGTDGTFYRVTGKCVEIANTLYGNWYLEDATGKVYIYGTLDKEGNAGKNNSIDVWGIEVGDELTVEGERTTYKETVELKNVKVIEIKKAAAEGKVWDFTTWSEATIANLKADAAASKTEGWSDVEKKADAEAGADPTEASKDNCFWSVAEPNADGELSANGVVIEELKGLKFFSVYSTARSLAIAVNYPSTSLGDYAGGAYLWLGGGKKKVPCFAIPAVAAGSTITMEVESHKPAEARGVELYAGLSEDGKTVDDATKIGDSFNPTTKDTHSWTIETAGDVIVYNTNGCHIYKIEITSGTLAIQVVKTAKADNGFIYNLAGQRVDANYKGVVIKNGQKLIQK
jgi:hypothetical protein